MITGIVNIRIFKKTVFINIQQKENKKEVVSPSIFFFFLYVNKRNNLVFNSEIMSLSVIISLSTIIYNIVTIYNSVTISISITISNSAKIKVKLIHRIFVYIKLLIYFIQGIKGK